MNGHELHCTDADTEPDENGRGGAWLVLCHSCEWQKHGRYSGLLISEPVALRIAHELGSKHEAAMNGVRA